MPDITQDQAAVRALLAGKPRIAMVGASDNPARDSNMVFRYLKAHGYDVVPVNPVAKAVEGVPTVPDLKAAAAQGRIDLVDVFRAPDALPGIVDEVLAAKAPAVWLQLGVVHEPSIRRLAEAGVQVVVDRCIKVEHARHGLA